VKIAIVKYNSGNTASVCNALRRLGAEPVITDDAEALRSADKVIFPGVGEASTAMAYLRARRLDETIRSLRQPVLGICLGMQLLCASSDENNTQCLGLLPHRVTRFRGGGIKVPHVGWNAITHLRGPLFEGVAEDSHVYFVHGYYVGTDEHTAAACDHGTPFSAAITYRNFYAVQFHAEKSGATGERILENFISL
jgi:imidazole glycerol-phosphate synthase subunit HisH